jgi:hypothetical protein
VAQDHPKAVYWFRKSAESGNSLAQAKLGSCYYNGNGVPKDEIEAYAYFNIAGASYENARKIARGLESIFPREDLVEGRRRTRELLKEIEAKQAGK